MFRGPENAPTGDRLRQILIDGLLKECNVGAGEVTSLADLVVDHLPGGVIVRERGLESSLKGRDSIASFSQDRKSTRLNSSHIQKYRMPSSA